VTAPGRVLPEAPPAVYLWRLTVPPDALDHNHHVNNVVYLSWVQEAATRHAEAAGCTAATSAAGALWVVREHRLRYLRPAFAGDELEVRTWVATMARFTSLRRTEIARVADGATLLRASTEWAFVDRASGRPRRLPPEVAAAFVLLPDEPGTPPFLPRAL
jgi:acyl-CoA thioester hydrolase